MRCAAAESGSSAIACSSARGVAELSQHFEGGGEINMERRNVGTKGKRAPPRLGRLLGAAKITERDA